MIKHLEIKVSGKVQEVFFRASAKRVADGLGLTGFAKNCDDGSVCIEAEGDEATLRKFLEWCSHGPALASVQNVDHEFTEELKNFKSFNTL